jgi:hypothetical protein
MRKAAVLVLCALAGVAVGLAQQPANTTTNQGAMPQTQNGSNSAGNSDQNTGNSGFAPRPAGSAGGDVPANTEMRATLDTPLSSKTSKPGDRFTATIAQPVQGQNGVVVPTGARVEGEVSESEQGKDGPALRGKGKLNLRLRDIVLPNGETVPLAAALVSVNHTNGQATQKADNEGQMESGAEGRNAARDAGIGAGEMSGLTFGGPLKGLAIGAQAGGGYVLATNGKDVNLPAQTGMVIRLDQELVIQ